jgi:hypothetical protein
VSLLVALLLRGLTWAADPAGAKRLPLQSTVLKNKPAFFKTDIPKNQVVFRNELAVKTGRGN